MSTPEIRTRAVRRPARRGPVEGEAVIGADADRSRRPGVPREARDPGRRAPRESLARQGPDSDKPLIRRALDRPTPVFGTAQPPRGLSGVVRYGAYRYPEHLARHWMLLLLADRVDALEDDLGPLVAGPLEAAGLHGAAGAARRNPLGLVAGVVAGAWLAGRLAR